MDMVVKGGCIYIYEEGVLLGIVEIPTGKTVDETKEMLLQVMEEGFGEV